MKKEAYERLKPFLHRKSSRQHVILYLIADGYTVAQLVALEVSTLRDIELPADIDVRRDETLNGHKSGPAFAYPNGKGMPHTAFYRLIRQTCEKVIGRPMSQEKFREYINKV